MKTPHHVPTCSPTLADTLHLFLDGELAFAEQPALFAHLAQCEACRRTLDSTLRFRQMSRQEQLAVPPSMDDAFFQRLDRHKAAHRQVDRAAERRPLWQARTPVSLRAAVVSALLVFIIGLLIPINVDEAPVLVGGADEQVDLGTPVPPVPVLPAPSVQAPMQEAVYVFYPGVVIEAIQNEDVRLPDQL